MGTLTDPIVGARHTQIGGLIVDEIDAGIGRVKRVIYPPGWRWSDEMAEVTSTGTCQHVHVGMLVQGTMLVRFDDGCEVTYTTPSAVVLEPGHDGWVMGDEAAVLVQVDAGPDTAERMGLESLHHTCTG